MIKQLLVVMVGGDDDGDTPFFFQMVSSRPHPARRWWKWRQVVSHDVDFFF